MHTSRFSFVTCGPFSGINDAILPLLNERFAGIEADVFDVPSWIRRRPGTIGANLIRVLSESGPRAFANRDGLWGAFYRTSYLFDAVRCVTRERAAGNRYVFSLQTQSLFDASVPGIPHFVYTDHTALVNLSYADFSGPEPDPRWVKRERSIYEHAEVVFTMSNHVSRSLIEDYGQSAEKVQCVHAGATIAPSLDPDYGTGEEQRILFVGREWERKGGPELVEAFTILRRDQRSATLAIVGCTPEVREAGVEVLGELPAASVEEQYRLATVFCMPTKVEPFGVVFVEALTHGVPVVATSVGAVPDIVQDGETGYLVEPGDTHALAQSLAGLLGDPERRRAFGSLGRRRMAERFSWPRVADAIAATISRGVAVPPEADT